MFNKIRLFILVASLVAFGASAAMADDIGAVGTIVGLQINDDSADEYLGYHGRVYVKDASKNLVEYRWGGASCGTRTLTAEAVASLQSALNSKVMRIEPRTQLGQGNAVCLVGFLLVPKKELPVVIP